MATRSRRTAVAGAAVLVVALAAVAFPYQRQIWSFLTHRKGSPTPWAGWPTATRGTCSSSSARRTGEADFTGVSFSWHHFVELDVFADRLVGRAVNQEERVADSWAIEATGGHERV